MSIKRGLVIDVALIGIVPTQRDTPFVPSLPSGIILCVTTWRQNLECVSYTLSPIRLT